MSRESSNQNVRYGFVTDCVHADGEDIQKMVDEAREISRAKFTRYVNLNELRRLERRLGYAQAGTTRGLTMAKDWHVRYFKSKYRGRPCVYIDHSAIEYVFVQGY